MNKKTGAYETSGDSAALSDSHDGGIMLDFLCVQVTSVSLLSRTLNS